MIMLIFLKQNFNHNQKHDHYDSVNSFYIHQLEMLLFVLVFSKFIDLPQCRCM